MRACRPVCLGVCVVGWIHGDRYEWAKDGFGDLLMMALPHHMDILDRLGGSVAVAMTDGYQSIKVRTRLLAAPLQL